MNNPANGATRVIYSVSDLNRRARIALGEKFGVIWVEGEISNLSIPSSGHLYFTLKDENAQVRCALFRGQARLLCFKPENGAKVLIKAEVSLYEPRGDYQLIADYMEPAGEGDLRLAFEALKKRLAQEGLFDASRKKPIPTLPSCIGVITSPTGAAIRDILTALKRRFKAVDIILFPVKVQGNDAKQDIVKAIKTADHMKRCDVLIISRGGGSIEDLWPFNEEIVARAMSECQTPIISGIGHETDFTIADLIADLRMPTPSQAAEAASPDSSEWLARIERIDAQMRHHMKACLLKQHQTLGFLNKRLAQAHPQKRLQNHSQRLDELEARLIRSILASFSQKEARLQTLSAKIQRHQPNLNLIDANLKRLDQRLNAAMQRRLENQQNKIGQLAEKLNTVSPLATLARGYSITHLKQDDPSLLRSFKQVKKGDLIETRLHEGILISRVEQAKA